MGGYGKLPGVERHERGERVPRPTDPSLLATSHDIGPRLVQFRVPLLEQVGEKLGAAFSSHSRPLTEREIHVAKPVFEESIDYRVVRVVRTDIINRPTTLGNVIRRKYGTEGEFNDAILVHELTHVWQFQTHGAGYMTNALCGHIFENDPYKIHASQLGAVRSFNDLSAERQGRVVELYFVSQLWRSADSRQHDRSLREFGRYMQYMTDPNDFDNPALGLEQFMHECAQLDRLVGEMRRARPIHALDRYIESVYGPGPWNGVDGRDPHSDVHAVPIFRLDF